MKFRKKPIVIEAVQFIYNHGGDGNYDEIGKLVDGWDDSDTPFIQTLEGKMLVRNGDWIITGVAGEHYPCKPDIFEKTYERIILPTSMRELTHTNTPIG